MRKVTLEYSALYYLNWWLVHDRHYCEALSGTDDEQKRNALLRAAAAYRVVRNLRVQYEREHRLPRLQRALEIISEPERIQFVGSNLIPAITMVRDRLCAAYGRKDLLSLTSKFLWLRFKSPIVIYDRNAREALGTGRGDLEAFYAAWKREYGNEQVAIRAACESLVTVTRHCIEPETATPAAVATLVAQEWFQERVFDIYLWYLGA